MDMINIRNYRFEWSHIAILLVFLFPLFSNTLRHWASTSYALLALFVLISAGKYTYDLNKQEKIFLAVIALHVISTVISNALTGWTYASNKWFFSGELRFLLAIPIYLYLRSIPEIWKYLLISIPFGAIIIGLTGITDFMLKYTRGDVGMIFAEGVYGHIFQGNVSVLWSVLSYAAFEYYKGHKKLRMICLAGAFIGAMGAFVSVTRNAWLSVVLLYMIVFFMQGGVRRAISVLNIRKVAVILLVFMGVLYFLSGIEYVESRFKRIYEEPVAYMNSDRSETMKFTSIGFRLEQWRGVLYAFEEKPVFGHGVGNSGKVHNRYIREGRLNDVIYQEPTEKLGTPSHVHNAYFEYLGDTGLIGFIAIILVIYYAPYVAFRSRNNGGLAWKFVILHGMAFGIASLTEVPFIRNNWTSIYFLPAIVFFIWLMHDNEKAAAFVTNK